VLGIVFRITAAKIGPAAPMNPETHKKTFIAAVAALSAAAVGLLFWHHVRTTVSPAEVAAFLDGTMTSGRVRFTVAKVETQRRDDSGQRVAVTAKAWLVQPLYSKADVADYLLRTYQLDPEASAEARALLIDKATARNPSLTGGRPLPPDPYQLVILQPATQADASFNFQGILDAHRAAGAWAFSLVSGGLEGGGPLGDARATFGSPSFVVGDAGDEAQLRTLVGNFQDFAGRVAKVRKDAEMARAAVVDGRRNAFLARIAPGKFFSGTALEAGEQYGTPLFLEITGLSGNGVTAVLRNEGSWHNGRVFQGTWGSDDEFQTTTLSLSSSSSEAVRNAGPFLENTQNWSLALSVDPAGRLTGQNKYFQYLFQPTPPAEVAALRARLEAEFEQSIAATEPGSLFQGSASSLASGASEPILLRFASRSDDGKSFEATIESPTHSWKRAFQGRIIDNARRSRGEPLRLSTGANDAVMDAPADSILGDQDDLEIALSPADGSLTGADARFAYRLARAEETDLHRLAAGRAQRARHFLAVLRDGIAFDGAFREDQGFITHARLEVARVDRETGAITAAIRSLARSKVYRDFTGTCDPAGGSIALVATGRGSFGEDGSFDIPFLTSASASTVHLELTGNAISGRIEGDSHWIMEFPTGSFLSATTEGSEPNAPPANGSVFPAFPKEPGAYLLTRASWSPMPRNNGHVVIVTESAKSNFALPTNIMGAVNAGISALSEKKEKQKIPYLVFDGKVARPESSGPAMVILFVGPKPSGKAQLEIAPAELEKEGNRRIQLPDGTPAPKEAEDASAEGRSHLKPAEVRLGDARLAAYVRDAGPGYTLFTTTSTLVPGPYVFNADAPYELTEE
jgi:hypothetical protein